MKTNLLKLTAFLLIAAGLFSACKEKEEPWTGIPEPVWPIIDIDPAWSPDEQWIVYNHLTGFGGYDIYLIRPDGTENTLWHAGGDCPTWSPCGEWIAFSQYAQIWKKKLNGDSLTLLTNDAGRHFFTAWSPDGKTLVYNQTVCNTMPCGLWKLDLDTETHEHIIWYGMYFDFNPVTGHLIYTKSWETTTGNNKIVMGDSVFVHNLSLGTNKFIVSLGGLTARSQYLKYNNTGAKILFTSSSITSDEHQIPGIWIMDANGANVRKLIDRGEYACWSPDGTKIVYSDNRKENGRLWIANADGSGKRQLTFDSLFENP